jgi:hypothetical protein
MFRAWRWQMAQTAAADKGCGGQRWGGEAVADETHYNIARSKATKAQTILHWEGRPDIALHNTINLSHCTQ